MKRNQKGFSAVEGLLILVIIGLVGFIGWYVYHSKSNAEATLNQTNKTTSTNPANGLKTYSDDFVSLKYPATWSVKRDDNTNLPGTKELVLTGPNDAEVASSIGMPHGRSAHLKVTIFKGVYGAATEAKVYDIIALHIPDHPNAKLAAIAETGPAGDPSGPPAQLSVTDDPSVQIGSTKLKDGLTVGSDTVGIWAIAMEYQFNDLAKLKTSQSVQEFTQILNSLTFK